jgi:hypothetical protein
MMNSIRRSSDKAVPADQSPADVYSTLARHQVSTEWKLRNLMEELHCWADRFNFAFKLQIRHVSLCVDWLRAGRHGHFRCGHNAFGLRGEIAINRRHLHDGEFWEILGTLCHELVHAWQEEHGRPGRRNYHNRQFCRKALELGLIVDAAGHTEYDPAGAFAELLRTHGVEAPMMPVSLTSAAKHRGSSKLKLWMCACPIRVRVAVAHFHARCLNCGSDFVRVE